MRFSASFSDTTARCGRSILSSLMAFSLFMLLQTLFLLANDLSMNLFLLHDYVSLNNGGVANPGQTLRS
jgi:hypothetical protein